MLAPGSTAPEFELLDGDGKPLSLQDLRGQWVVFWWYPKASSGSCTAEGQAFKEWGPQFEERGARIVGVSFDSGEDNCSFAEEHGFEFPLLSDPTREVGRAYEVVRPEGADFAELPYRYTYLIDPKGVIRRSYDVGVDIVSSREHPAEVLADLDALLAEDAS